MSMAHNAIFQQDLQIKDATRKLESFGFTVERQGLRTRIYKEKVPMSKWLEIGQLLGQVRYYCRHATPMELALLRAGLPVKR
jgi:hypothetical protein